MMNKQQMEYAEAKALRDALNDKQIENEALFIAQSGYAMPDGTVPKALYMIDDEEVFMKLCDEFERSPLNLWTELQEANKSLAQAEDALIDYSLSIVPTGVRETLDKHRKEWKVREKMLDAAFRLDTSTVPKTWK